MMLLWIIHYCLCFLYGFYSEEMGIGLIGALVIGLIQFMIVFYIQYLLEK